MRKMALSLVRWQHFGLLLLVLTSAALHLAVIASPPEATIFDEPAYVKDARRINDEARTERPEHPPLGKLLIAKGMKLFGDNPWGWRLPAVVTSSAGLALFYGICRRLSRRGELAYLATFLLAFENFYFIHSAVAMLDVYLVFFTILAFWFYLKGPAWWWAAAVSGALAALCKFSGAFVFIAIGAHWLYTERQTVLGLFRRRSGAETSVSPEGAAGGRGRILVFVSSMLLAPVAFILIYQSKHIFTGIGILFCSVSHS